MTQVFDTATAKVVEAPDDLIASDAKRYQPIGNQITYMVSPDGKQYNIPAASAADAVSKFGWKFADDKSIQAFKEEDQTYHENNNPWSVGIRQGGNQLAFGVPDIVEEHEHSAAYNKGMARAVAEHPIANIIGGGIGLGANLLATEGAGALVRGGLEGAEAGAHVVAPLLDTAADVAEHGVVNQLGEHAITPVVAMAGKEGVEAGITQAASNPLVQKAFQSALQGAKVGAIYSSPSAVAQFAYGDKEAAAENLAIGIGSAGLLGLGAGVFTGTLEAGQALLRSKLAEHGFVDEAGKIIPDKLQSIADELPGLRGSILTDAAGAISSVASALIGHAVGITGVGGYFYIRPVIDTLMKHLVLSKGLDVSTNLLRKMASDPAQTQWVGAALTKNLWDSSIQKIAKFPEIMLGKAAVGWIDPIKAMLGSEGSTGKSKDQQFATVNDKLQLMQQNPGEIQKQIQALSTLFGHDPELQKLLAQQQINTLKYLWKNQPHPPDQQPFTQQQPKITEQEKKDFLDKLEIATAPDNIAAHMKDGTLTDSMVQAMQALYPKRYQQYLGQVLMMAYDPKYATLPQKTITMMAKYVGNPLLDPHVASAAQDQLKFATPPAPMPPPAKGKGTSQRATGTSKISADKAFGSGKFASSLQTQTDRLQYK